MKKSGSVVISLLAMLFVFPIGCASVAKLQKTTAHVNTTDLQDAVCIATSALHGPTQYTADRWTLISARQILIDGRYVWRIIFKPTELLPDDPSTRAIGAGGEVFVNVDQATKKIEILYGE